MKALHPSFSHQDFHIASGSSFERKRYPTTNAAAVFDSSLFSYKIQFFFSYNKQNSTIFSITKMRYDELFLCICCWSTKTTICRITNHNKTFTKKLEEIVLTYPDSLITPTTIGICNVQLINVNHIRIPMSN